MNGQLKKRYFAGDHLTLADFKLGILFKLAFQFVFDKDFREKEIPTLTSWFVRISKIKSFKQKFGNVKLAAVGLKPFAFIDLNKPKDAAPAKAQVQAPKTEAKPAPPPKKGIEALPPPKLNLVDFKNFFF